MGILENYHTEIRYVACSLFAYYLVWSGNLNSETALAIMAGLAFPSMHFIESGLNGKNNQSS